MKSFDPWNTILTDEAGDVVWPRPSYGNALYEDIPSWLNYSASPQRLLFDGTFIGAEAPKNPFQELEIAMLAQTSESPVVNNAPPREGLLAEVAPHVAPATGPISVKKTFDDSQVLHVEICLDGKCYRTSMDLGPAIKMVMAKMAQWHKEQHASEPHPSMVVGAVENAVHEAGNAMADTMVCHHVNAMVGGIFDDIGSAIGGTLRKLAPVISTVATGVATAVAGPGAGAVAGQLVPVVTSLQANLLDPKGDPKKKATAQQQLQRVQRLAQSDPRLARALAAAHKAVRDTAVAYHVKGAVDKATAGDPAAKQDVAAVVRAADQGDPAAKSTYEVIAQTLLDKAQHSEWGAQLWNKVMGQAAAPTSTGRDLPLITVGSFWDDVSNAVATVISPALTGTKAVTQAVHDLGLEPYVKLAAQGVATAYGGPAAGAAVNALAPSLMNLGSNDKQKAAAAQQEVQGVTALAQQHSPEMAQAVDVAKGSVKGAATAYHIDHLLKMAKKGDQRAQRALARLQRLAAEGNVAAQRALQAVNTIHQEQQKTTVSGWYDIVGAVLHAPS